MRRRLEQVQGMLMAKRHHYVPVTYLKQCADLDGRIHMYCKDEPDRSLPIKPQATGFESCYYSQLADDGTRDDDGFGALLSRVETE